MFVTPWRSVLLFVFHDLGPALSIIGIDSSWLPYENVSTETLCASGQATFCEPCAYKSVLEREACPILVQ